MYTIEPYKKDNAPYYFAMIYGIKYKDDNKHEDEVEIDEKIKTSYVRISKDDDKIRTKSIHLKDTFRIMFLPHINREGQQERDVLYISGSSGSGKSYLVNSYAELYKSLTKNKVIYLTSNNVEKDRSLNQEIYEIINVEKFLEHYADEENFKQFITDSPEFDNSLIIFDDIGAIHDKKQNKIMWDFINVILENKRKNGINICVISHVPTNYKQTSLIIRETRRYVVFPQNLQVKSDRFLKGYLGLTGVQINKIVNLTNTKWACVDVIRRLLITQREIIPL